MNLNLKQNLTENKLVILVTGSDWIFSSFFLKASKQTSIVNWNLLIYGEKKI